MMKIILNGQQRDLPASTNLQNVVDLFCKGTVRVMAEVNGQIIKRPQWSKTAVNNGDAIELINFVGGG